MMKTNLIEELDVNNDVKEEIEMQKNVYLKQYTSIEIFNNQLAKISIFFMHLSARYNWNVKSSFFEDDNIKHFIATMYIKNSYFRKYKFYFSYEMINSVEKYTFFNEYYKLYYFSDNFEELFSRLCDDHLKLWTPWVLKLRKEKE